MKDDTLYFGENDKTAVNMRLFHRYESLAKKFWGRHLGSRGYCVNTVGLDEEKIRQYVRWQEKQEKKLKTR